MSSLKVNSVVDAAGGNTATVNGYTPTMSNMAGKNRIINGDMRIDQRNAGASVTPSNTSKTYTVDRFAYIPSQGSKFAFQQTPSVTETGYATRVAAGFTNYLAATSQSAYAIGSTDYFLLGQYIEGFNTIDLAWGTAAAKPVTLSFWVYSSLTGNFGATINNNNDQSYPVLYNIPVANTWTYVTINIPGATSGTWNKTTGQGIAVQFSLGTGSTYCGTSGVWSGTVYLGATGQVNVVGTSGATFFITGVQLEAGSVATPFEHRQYGQELALCQRYYWRNQPTITNSAMFGSGYADSSTRAIFTAPLPVPMRTTPSMGFASAGSFVFITSGTSPTCTSISAYRVSPIAYSFNMFCASGLTAGQALLSSDSGTTSAYIETQAEL